MKIIGRCKDDTTGYCAFAVEGPDLRSRLSATFEYGGMTLNLPVFETGVGFDAAVEDRMMMVAFPLVSGTGRLTLLSDRGDGPRALASTEIRPRQLYFESRYIHWKKRPLFSMMQYRCHRATGDIIQTELIGLYPLDDADMACRVSIQIPRDIDSPSWSWTIGTTPALPGSPAATVLSDRELQEDGILYRALIVSFRIPRDTTSFLVSVSDDIEGHMDGFLSCPEEVISRTLDVWYHRSADAKAALDFPGWFLRQRATRDELEHQRATQPAGTPSISIIVPVYQPPMDFLVACVDSVRHQTYVDWELILVDSSPERVDLSEYLSSLDDPRIRTIVLERNLGIAGNTNAGIREAKGDYIGFMDQDDIIEPDALYEYVQAIAADPGADLLYCDEDSFEGRLPSVFSPLLKPDFNPDLLYGHDYIIHLLMVSRHALEKVELSPDYVSGAQDYDLTLKVSEVARSIVHIDRILYHWRQHAASTNAGNMAAKPYAEEAGRRALLDHFSRTGIEAQVETTDTPAVYRTTFAQENPGRMVSIILTGVETEAVAGLIGALRLHAGSSPFEILLPSADARLQNPAGRIDIADAKVIPVSESATRRQLVEAAAEEAAGELLLLVDGMSSVLEGGWLDLLAGFFQRADIGCVAPLIHAEDGLIEHAGLALSPAGSVLSMNRYHTLETNKGYLGCTECGYDYPAVTSRFMMVRKTDFKAVGGLQREGVAGDVEFCSALRRRGLYAVYTPHVSITQAGWAEDATDDEAGAPGGVHVLDLASEASLTGSCDGTSAYFALREL